MSRVYVVEHRSRTAHIDGELEHTALDVGADLVTIIQRRVPSGWGSGSGSRDEVTLRIDDLVEALRKLGLI